MTSAPRSASTIAQNGPGPMPATSTTRTPGEGSHAHDAGQTARDAARRQPVGLHGVDGAHEGRPELPLGAGHVPIVERAAPARPGWPRPA